MEDYNSDDSSTIRKLSTAISRGVEHSDEPIDANFNKTPSSHASHALIPLEENFSTPPASSSTLLPPMEPVEKAITTSTSSLPAMADPAEFLDKEFDFEMGESRFRK